MNTILLIVILAVILAAFVTGVLVGRRHKAEIDQVKSAAIKAANDVKGLGK